MNRLAVSPLLRLALRLDAVASLASGLLSCLFAQTLAAWLGAAPDRVLAVGVFMIAYGAAVGWLGLQSRLAPGAVWLVVVGNTIWVLASVTLAFSGWIAPNALGLALLLSQAAAVALFAELQYLGLRASTAANPA